MPNMYGVVKLMNDVPLDNNETWLDGIQPGH